MSIRYLRYLIFVVIAPWTMAHTEQQTVSQRVDAILEKHKDLLDKVQSPAFIDQKIARGQESADYYTNPDVINRLIHPEKVQRDKQQSFNQQLLYEFSVPLNGVNLPVGIYHRDALFAAHVSIMWGVEWWFYVAITNIMADIHTQQLLQPQQASSTRIFIKKIMPIIVLYVLANISCDRLKHYWLLHEPFERSPDKPLSISTALPASLIQPISMYLTPQSWITAFNDLFKKIGWLPDWTKNSSWIITKECFATCMWLWWYHKNIVQASLKEYREKNKDVFEKLIECTNAKANSIQEEQELNNAKKALRLLVNNATHLSFSHWLMFKTVKMGLWHSVATLASATPAWVQFVTWIYQTYKTITATKQYEKI